VGSGRAAHGAAETAEEAEWVERAQGGDTEAFRRLIERHQDRAYGLAFRILGTASDAEEAAQDAFVRVWRALPEFRGEARFGTWLHRIVVRCACDLAARLRRRSSKEESLDALMERYGIEPSCAGAGASPAEGQTRRLERVLEGLTDAQRVAVTLYYYEDRSVEEVGRVLELPANTVKTHLHRARAALRAALRREEAAES
jgi:RNA polymerase sigma-70 factor (ECF subfamily)